MIKKIIHITLSMVFAGTTLWPSTAVFAATPPTADLEAIELDSVHYQSNYVNNYVCSASPTLPTTITGSVYMLGDSITNGARTNIEAALTGNGFSIAGINADPGRAISVDTAGNNPSGLEAAAADASTIASAGIIIVALGTNSGTEDLNVQIPALITAIRANASPQAQIFWVNLFYNGSTRADRNNVISSLATAQNYSVLDTTTAGIALQPDGVHPTAAGNETFAQLIASSLGDASPPTSLPGSDYNPTSLNFPAFPNEGVIAQAITDYIQNRTPSSPFLTIPGIELEIGAWLIAESKTRDINPLFIVASGKMENNFGTVGSAPRNNNNFFGMTNGRGGYLDFPTPQAGITAFMDAIKNNIYGDGAGGRYRAAKNIYEYFSIHQSGVIAYPGENLDPNDVSGPGGRPDGNRLDGFDPIMDVYISWTRTDHPNNRYDGNLYNPLIYFRSNIEVVNAITGFQLSAEDPRAIANGGMGGCVDTVTGIGEVTIDGYAFPLAPQTRAVGGIRVGQTTTGHHDGTPAYDLFSTDSAKVYAIYSGTVIRVNTSFQGVPGCSTIQFRADDDPNIPNDNGGFYYWYGHLKNVTVSVGQHVSAGAVMAEIADPTRFSSSCWGGGPHLHIDRGCTINGVPQPGGSDSCRDPNFIPFLSKIYESLPG